MQIFITNKQANEQVNKKTIYTTYQNDKIWHYVKRPLEGFWHIVKMSKFVNRPLEGKSNTMANDCLRQKADFAECLC